MEIPVGGGAVQLYSIHPQAINMQLQPGQQPGTYYIATQAPPQPTTAAYYTNGVQPQQQQQQQHASQQQNDQQRIISPSSSTKNAVANKGHMNGYGPIDPISIAAYISAMTAAAATAAATANHSYSSPHDSEVEDQIAANFVPYSQFPMSNLPPYQIAYPGAPNGAPASPPEVAQYAPPHPPNAGASPAWTATPSNQPQQAHIMNGAPTMVAIQQPYQVCYMCFTIVKIFFYILILLSCLVGTGLIFRFSYHLLTIYISKF